MQFLLRPESLPTHTAQHKGARMVNGHIMFYTKPEIRKEQADLADLLEEHVPAKPFDGPIQVSVTWAFPPTKNKSRKPGDWHSVRPDGDNLTKLLLDVMTAMGFWKDDAQISRLIIQKITDTEPGIFIAMEGL